MFASFKRAYLIGLLAITALAAVVIVGSLLTGPLDWRWIDTLESSGVGVGCLLALGFAAYTAFDRRGWCIVAIAGALVAGVMMFAMPLEMHFEMARTSHSPADDLRGQMTAFGMFTAGLFCLVPFVMAPKLKFPGLLVQIATTGGYAVLYCFILAMIWDSSGPRGLEDAMPFLAAVGVLTVAGTIAVFVLQRFFAIKIPDALGLLVPSIFLRCPRCQKEQDLDIRSGRCAHCKLRIRVEIEEPRCPGCGYNLHSLTRPICPECGMALREEDISSDLMKWAQANDLRQQ